MAYQFHNVSILIVEDNLPMLNLVKSILQTFGVTKIYGAKNGEEGFDKFCKNNPDIVISDWMMAPMDGIKLTQMIRQNPKSPNPLVPIILITGYSEKRRVIKARDVGITEFMVKPFNARDLYRRLVQIIEKPRQFVRTENFFGPDRRRSRTESYNGPKRRADDFADYSSAAASEIDFM